MTPLRCLGRKTSTQTKLIFFTLFLDDKILWVQFCLVKFSLFLLYFSRCDIDEEPEDDDEALQASYVKTYKKQQYVLQ